MRRYRHLRITGLSAVALAVVLAGLVGGGARAAPSPLSPMVDLTPSDTSTDEIAYLATKGTIYVINADGTGRRELLTGSAMDTFNWSPDGQAIAFTAGSWGRAGLAHTEIRITAANGAAVRTLSFSGLTSVFEPTWSPDGAQLAFTGWNRPAHTLSIYVINADGTGSRRLARPPSPMWDANPDWSPDGSWIAFERYNRNGESATNRVRQCIPMEPGFI